MEVRLSIFACISLYMTRCKDISHLYKALLTTTTTMMMSKSMCNANLHAAERHISSCVVSLVHVCQESVTSHDYDVFDDDDDDDDSLHPVYIIIIITLIIPASNTLTR